MELTFDRLIKFDLIEKLETRLFKTNKWEPVRDFSQTLQAIQSTEQFIKDSPSFPGSTDKIVRSELISAIGATLSIEGTILGKEEIEESFQKASLNETLKRKEQEAENSRKVYKFIIDLVRSTQGSFVYKENMIKQMHKYFTEKMNYLGNRPGEYRNFPTTFGVPRQTGLCKTGAEVGKAMSGFISWLNRTDSGILSSSIIVKAIMSHYYMAEIHPFADGNGRTARALEALVLYVNGVNSYCFWSLANFWSVHRDEYLVHLRNIRNICDPWDFIAWGMKGYLEETKRVKALVLKKVKQLMIMDYAKYLLNTKKKQRAKINQRTVDVLELLVRSGRVPLSDFQSFPEVTALFKNVSPTTKYRDFRRMAEAHLVGLTEENTKTFIEPNYRILDYLSYNV